MAAVKKRKFEIPIFAVGGIETSDIPSLLQAGVAGVAISGFITNAIDKDSVIEQIYNQLQYAGASNRK